MSKKGKPTQAIMIEVSGNTVWAHVANAHEEHLECIAGYAKCHPNDTFDFYEGARIALARAFGKDPFPKTDDAEKPSGKKPEEKTDVIYHPTLGFGRWVKAGNGKNGKPGDWIRIDKAWAPTGYKNGDILVISEPEDRGCLAIVPDSGVRYIACHEYSIWLPKDLSSQVPKKKKEEPKPMDPSFQVGDIVRTEDSNPFAPGCRKQPAKVIGRRCEREFISYDLSVIRANGNVTVQFCSEFRERPAPLTLLWREEK